MKLICDGLAWAAFFIMMTAYIWVEHIQYTQGHNTLLFTHKTPEELRIREAVIQKLENEAARGKPKP